MDYRGARIPLLLLEFRLEYGYDIVNGVLLKVGLVDECLARSVEHILGCDATHILEGIDHPSVDLILELVKIDVLIHLVGGVTVHIYGISLSLIHISEPTRRS